MINKLFFILIFLSTFGFTSCHDSGPDITNTASAKKDSTEWKADVFALFEEPTVDSLIYLRLKASYGPGALTEELNFSDVPTRVGEYPLYPHTFPKILSRVSTSLYLIEGGDVTYDSYSLDTTKVNLLIVESFDSYSRKIIVSFKASYITNHHNQLPEDTVSFIEGKIMAVVEN